MKKIYNLLLLTLTILGSHTAFAQPPAIDLGPDQTLCQGDSIVLEAPTGYSNYEWSTGLQQTWILTVTEPGTYWVHGMVQGAVISSDTIVITDCDTTSSQCSDFRVELDIINDSCSTQNGYAEATALGGLVPYTYLWTNGETTSAIDNLSFGQIGVTATDNNGCTFTTGDLIDNDCGTTGNCGYEIDLGPDLAICNGNEATLGDVNGKIYDSYQWSTGETTANIDIKDPGMYWLEAENDSCVYVDSIMVTVDQQCFDSCSQALPDFVIVANNDKCGAGTGSIVVEYSGGNYPPYTLMFAGVAYVDQSINGRFEIDNLHAGTYTFTITDREGCSETNTAIINDDCQQQGCDSLYADITVISNDSCSSGNGYLESVVTGGTAPYAYQWSNGETSDATDGLHAGTYTLKVTDANGCVSTTSATVTSTSTLSVVATPSHANCGGTGSASALVTGGTTPYSYIWSNGVTTQTISSLTPGSYTVLVTDANGCSETDDVDIQYADSGLTISITTTGTACQNSDGSATATITGGNEPFTYSWSTGETTQTINNLSVGIYTVTTTDNNGCTATESATIEGGCVWPGDANSDGVANVWDILPIGIGFGTNGSARQSASTTWVGQAAADWNDNFGDGVNYKHADCDGDGEIGFNDVPVILDNYGKTHSKTEGHEGGRASDASLYLSFLEDTLQAGNQVSVAINLGTAEMPAQDIYGLAFALTYDPIFIDSGSVSVDFSGSWLADGSSIISVRKDFYEDGRIEIGVSRIDGIDRSGHDLIATLSFILEDDLIGKGEVERSSDFRIVDQKIIDATEEVVEVNVEEQDSVLVIDPEVGLDYINLNDRVEIFPNPTRSSFSILLNDVKADRIDLVNPMGQIIQSVSDVEDPYQTFDLTGFNGGIYFIQIQSGNSLATKRVILIE